MFHLIKYTLILIGLLTVAYFLLPRFGYKINMNYFTESKQECQQRLNDCGQELVRQGTENAQCSLDCVDPKLIIKKSEN